MPFISYAQNFEDVMLWRALGGIKQGFYIDVGAADPVDMSVTQAFYETGWHGVNVEPAPHYFDRLRAARPADVNLEVAVGRTPASRMFYEIDQSGLSTLNPKIAAEHEAAGWTVRRRQVELTTLAEICRHYAPGEIHFLKIDVEGAEDEVLAGADFTNFRPWIVLLEATKPLTTTTSIDWEPALVAARYKFVWFDGLNRFYVALEHHEALRSHFELPPNSFDDFVKYDFERQTWAAERQAVDQQKRELERHLQGRLNEVRLLDQEVRLRRASQSQAAAELIQVRSSLEQTRREYDDTQRELKQVRQAGERLRQDLAAAEQKLERAEHAAQQEHQNWEVLTRLACELRWEDGPRALRLVLPLARLARKFIIRKPRALPPPAVHSEPVTAPPSSVDASEPIFPVIAPEPPIVAPARSARLRHAVHQFHPGSSYGDAITNGMLLTQRILRGLGYRSEIYVEHRDELLADRLLLLDDLPLHDDYVLIVRHSLGHRQAERLAGLPAPKILLYHNITPARFLSSLPALAELADLGRTQLDFWRQHVAAALSDSLFNALELYQHGFEGAAVCPLLFDVEALQARARPGFGRYESTPYTVLFVGRIVESKAQMDLVDTFDAFRRIYTRPCRLVLVGRFEGGGERYVQDVFERIGEHGLRQMVEITGQVSDDELAAWYDRADLFVSLSLHEGFGVPLIEAMAHDLPVIAYAAGAVPFTINAHGRDANTIFYSRDPATVAKTMLTIATDESLRSNIILENRKNLDRFALKHYVPVLVQALLRAGARRPPEVNTTRELASHLHFTIAGHFNGTYSLASANRALALALEGANPLRVRIEPVEGDPTSNLSGVPVSDAAKMQDLAINLAPETGPSVTISQHYPVHVPHVAAAAPDLLAAYFFWEESLVPAATIALLNRSFQGVLAPSRFVAKVLIDSGLRIKVRNVGFAPPLTRFARLGETKRRKCGPNDPFMFLHVSSAFPRKGVDVLLNAFARAFAGPQDERPLRLVIKAFSNPHNEAAAQIERLRKLHLNLPEIDLIERDISEDDLLALYRDADAMVLPTRGEGFNMPAAEAAAAGLPLIVTGAGGHMDFLTARDSVLLPWQVRHSRSHLNTGLSLWFEPDEAALAEAMRAVFDDLTACGGQTEVRAATARQAVLARLDSSTWAGRIADAAVDILLEPWPRPLRFAWMSSWDVRCGIAEYTRHYVSAFESLVAADDQLLILCDDRTAPQQAGRLKVVPSWQGNVRDVDWLARVINREDPDILMIQHQPGLIGWSSLATLLQDPRLRPRVVLVTLHTTLQLLDLTTADRAAVLAALQRVARVVVHTMADVNLLLDLGLFDNVVMIPQGVAMTPGAAPPARPLVVTDVPIIGCYGFLLPPKGLRRLISAFHLLQKRWPFLRLRLVNAMYPASESMAELEACQTLSNALGVSSRIDWFTDFLPHEQSMSLLGGCDLVVLPYTRTNESSSAALRSCLSSGAPVAVSSIAIFDEAEEAVCRIDGESSVELARGISALLSDVTGRQKLQDAAAKWIIPRAWNVISTQVHGMVSGLAANAALQKSDELETTLANSEKPIKISERRQESGGAA